jgi:hypothetical protein
MTSDMMHRGRGRGSYAVFEEDKGGSYAVFAEDKGGSHVHELHTMQEYGCPCLNLTTAERMKG